eukprot:284182_1
MASSNNTWITEMLQLINPHCTLNETIQQLASLGYNQAATQALCICEKETIECDDLDKEETPDRCLECVWLETQSDHSFEIHLSQEEELQDGVSSDHEELEYMRSLRLDSRYGVDKCESSRVDLICEEIASFGVEVESIC